MRTETQPLVRLSDYAPYPFEALGTELHFDLDPDRTTVRAKLSLRRRSDRTDSALRLDGEKLLLRRISVDGRELDASEYSADDEGLTVAAAVLPNDRAFVLETLVEIAPSANTELSGLYMSGGRFCTQCEAEGFRRITYYPDRPDVLAPFAVRIEADAAAFPYLLSNGNPAGKGALAGGRAFAEWIDPHPKPSYLFALVAGDFDVLNDSRRTSSGREVALTIYVDRGNAERAAYAMDSLKRAMAWDEDAFGREYDLDVFQIVAVRDFNFGAMENKGLNIFNSAYVLADGDTATDADFESVESIVAHEYFHNWTGNRITCRDWFQLCLKEGLTVFRDQEFSKAMRSPSVCRIKEVIRLRTRQFPEDAGPLAHPVRPQTYARIDNLYTATVYEKGAELIRMLRLMIGEEAFFAGMNRFFDVYDGKAATLDEFIGAFQPSTNRDLNDFARWYGQPGTPLVRASAAYDAAKSTFTLTLQQEVAPTAGDGARPLPLAVRVALFDPKEGKLAAKLDGAIAEEHVLNLAGASAAYRFEGVKSAPLASLNRGFSSPIQLIDDMSETQRAALAGIDDDAFSQWDALQTLVRGLIVDAAAAQSDAVDASRLAAYVSAVASACARAADDNAYAALLLRTPPVGELVQHVMNADTDRLHLLRTQVRRALASRLESELAEAVAATDRSAFDASMAAVGRRAFKAASLSLLATLGPQYEAAILRAFQNAGTMTERLAALEALSGIDSGAFDQALSEFEARHATSPLVMDKWFSVQAMAVRSDLRERLERLSRRGDYDLKNPNRVRALAAAFSVNNPVGFHAPDGWGYAFLADVILAVDPLNPSLSARLTTGYESWARFDPERRKSALGQLRRLVAANLSRNAADIAARALGEA